MCIRVSNQTALNGRMLFTNSTSSCLRPGDRADALIPVLIYHENPKVMLEDAVIHSSLAGLEAIKKWIVKNYHPSMRHWNGEIDSLEVISELR